MATLQQTLVLLVVPAAFAQHDRIIDTTVLVELSTWKSKTEPLLNRLTSFDVSVLSMSDRADLVRVLAPLTAVAQWTSPVTRSLASALLSRTPASDELVDHILTQVVKPLFIPTPHPRLHTSTARILSRPADVQDTYIEQPWKEHPGLDEVIRWCLLHTESTTYENAWPLFLPPVMSLLDDYQAPYKLLGIRLVSDMLTRVPQQLLLRTSVDTLIFNSLMNSMLHLRDHSTPDLIRSTVTTALQLIDLTTPSTVSSDGETQGIPTFTLTRSLSSLQSKSLSTRFSRLSTLLSSSLLGTVIMYTPTLLPPISAPGPEPFTDLEHVGTDPVRVPEIPLQGLVPQKQSFNPTLVVAAQSLPAVLSALGIGCARFLKGVIPVLAEWLALPLPIVSRKPGYYPNTNGETSSSDSTETHNGLHSSAADVTLHLAALSSLSVLFCTCTPRIGGWSATIVDAIGRCWIVCLDTETRERGDAFSVDSLHILKKQLKEIAVQLSRVCPDVIKNEFATLLAFNNVLFEGLVGECI